MTNMEADALILETRAAMAEISKIMDDDTRSLVVKLDLRDFAFGQLNAPMFMRYFFGSSEGFPDPVHIEIRGAGDFWPLLTTFLQKSTRDKMVYI